MKCYSTAHSELLSGTGYGAWRWHDLLGVPGVWYVVSTNVDFDRMRGLQDSHFKAVVDDYGNLVRVQ